MPAVAIVISDFLFTCFEVWGLIFLMQNEECKHGRAGVLAFGLSLVGFVLLMTRFNVPLLLKFGCVVLFVVTIGQITYSCRVFKLLFYALILIFAVYSSEMLVLQLWNLFNEPVYSDNIIYEEFTLSLIIIAKALYFFEMIIFEYIIKGVNKRRRLRDILPVFVSGVPYLVILEIINVSLALIKDKSMNLMFIFGSVIIFVAFICNILLMRYYWDIVDAEQQEKKSVYELQLKCEYYMKRMQDEEQIKSIYHDLKNHLLFSGEIVLKSQTMEKLRLYEKYYNTGNDFLDIVLADKIEVAWERGIHIECNIDFRAGSFLEPLDISTIFGNLLDNAIEAAEKLHENEKIIFFKIENRGELIIIIIKNQINYGENINVNMLYTHKENKQYHGFGISNVKKGVHKYNGECSFQVSNNEFIVSIVIPVPKQRGDETK